MKGIPLASLLSTFEGTEKGKGMTLAALMAAVSDRLRAKVKFGLESLKFEVVEDLKSQKWTME